MLNGCDFCLSVVLESIDTKVINMNAEQAYYEQDFFWTEDLYLKNPDELRRFSALAELIPSGVQSLLDVGCGNGAFLKVLEKAGHPTVLMGLERSSKAIEMSLCNTKIELGSCDTLPFDAHHFDVVSACEVIEHLPYGVFETTLSELSRVARSYLLISVPFRERRRFVRCPCCGTEFPSYFHLRTFDEKYLGQLFPDFRIIGTKELAVPVQAFSLHPRAYWDRLLKRRSVLDPGQICPLCNYSVSLTPSRQPPPGGIGRRIKDYLNSLIPKVNRAKWIAVLYERSVLQQ